MSERSIIFSAPMVRAILEGRKTQTRRVVRAPDIENADVWSRTPDELGRWEWGMSADGGAVGHGGFVRCPYGAPGDTLWVRETWTREVNPMTSRLTGRFLYAATDECDMLDDGDGYAVTNKDGSQRSPWKSPIHMPRAASRLTLRLTDVRVERLQEITDADAIAEGIGPFANNITVDCDTESPRRVFGGLWDSINGRTHPWSSNPWVWVVSFERVEQVVRS